MEAAVFGSAQITLTWNMFESLPGLTSMAAARVRRRTETPVALITASSEVDSFTVSNIVLRLYS